MAYETLIFVSKRLQRLAAAILCLMAAQLADALSSRQPPSTPPVTRMAIER